MPTPVQLAKLQAYAALPPITPFVGRISGTFEWLCPICAGMTRTLVQPRYPWVQCCMPSCHRTFPIGLVGHTSVPTTLAPFNAVYHKVHKTVDMRSTTKGNVPIVTHYYNRLAVDLVDAKPAIARIAGYVDWRCAACATFNLAYPDWHTGLVHCDYCVAKLWVSAALMENGKGASGQHPADWHGLRDRDDRLRTHNLRASRSLRRRQVKRRLVQESPSV